MEKEASQLERDHVHSVYEKIAPYFNDTRYKAWPKVRQFLLDQEPGSIIADIGCGNGKYLHINNESFKLGCDCCQPLVEAARSQGHEVQVCDGLRLPYRDGCFDAVLSIAVIHHFSTKERRIRAIKEMARTLRVGGRLMIYVWAMEQKRRKFEKQDIFVPWNPHPPLSAATTGDPGTDRRHERPSTFSGNRTDNTDKHRKTKSTSSMVDEEETVSTPHEKSLKLWFFSRSLDSVLDFGSVGNSRSARELNASCDYHPQVNKANGVKAMKRNRGVGLMKQVSSLFTSRQSSEEDVFSSVVDLRPSAPPPPPPPPPARDMKENWERNGSSASEKQALSAAIVHNVCDSGHGERPPPGGQEGKHKAEFPISLSNTESRHGDEETDKQNDTNSVDCFLRYYHVFKEGELLELIEKHIEELHVLQTYFDHANWCVIAEKVQVWKI
ncbi:TRM9B methyltransferase, partial [Amia calva]|nr:TRM9B methyltransferase [Amia calva]